MAVPQDLLDAMPYHLASDIAHDHGLGIIVNTQIKTLVRQTPRATTTDEDAVVGTFDSLMDGHDEYKKVLEQRQLFELPSSTETLPSTLDWSLPDDFAFVHDAGPKLFKMLGKKNYITYGTILDSASKPREDAVYVPIPTEVPKSVFQELGFSPNVGPLKLQRVSDTSLKVALSYYNPKKERGPNLYDMVGLNRVTDVAQGGVKEMGKPAGYLASVATVKEKITANTQPDLYIIGKALGDALQVMSVRDSGLTAPRLIHNTEDRLNFVRCRVFDVPAIHVKRKTTESPIRICEFIPSRAMITDTPETRFNRYLTKLKGFLQVTASNYDRVIKQFMDPQTALTPLTLEYCTEAVRQLQLLKIGTLFHFMTWTVYYDAKKASPTDEDAKAISGSHDILSASSKRLSPYGSITRINGLDYVQKFVVCHAPPDDCDLGGFPIVETGGTELRSRANQIVDALLGKASVETTSDLKIDVTGLQALLTEFGIQTDPLVAPSKEVSIPTGGGAGFGIRGTYYFELVQDAKSGKTSPSRVLVGGEKRKREDSEVPSGKKPRLDVPPMGTNDASLFEWYVSSKAPDVTPSEVLFHVKRLYDSKTGNDEVFDFGLVPMLEDEGIVPEVGEKRQRSLSVWNAFMIFVNRGLLDVGKSNPWVSLHGPSESDPILAELDDLEESFLRPPTPAPQTPPRPTFLTRKTRRRADPIGASRVLPSPVSGLSDAVWTSAVRELEARYNK